MQISISLFVFFTVWGQIYSSTLNCMEHGCSETDVQRLQQGKYTGLKIREGEWNARIRPHHLGTINHLWLQPSQNHSMLSLGSIVRKGSNINVLNLMYWPIHALQIPLDVHHRHLYMGLRSLMGLNVFSYTAESLKWLGGLQRLQIQLHQITWSRFPPLGQVKHISIHGSEIVTLGTLYFGRKCHIEYLELIMPKLLEILPNALSTCVKLKSFHLKARSLMMPSVHLIPYNSNLQSLSMNINRFNAQTSLSHLICYKKKKNSCYIPKINLEANSPLPSTLLGSRILTDNLRIVSNDSQQLSAVHPGVNLFLGQLTLINAKVSFHRTLFHIPISVQNITITQSETHNLNWLHGYDLSTIQYLYLNDNNITDIIKLMHTPSMNMKVMDLSRNKIRNPVLYFTHYGFIQHVDLSQNDLSYIQLVFPSSSLKFLNLSHNALTNLNVAITRVHDLTLDLSYNKLHEVSALTSLVGTINYINLSNNRLVDVSALQQIALDRPTTLDLTMNPLECACANAQSLIWADKQKHTVRRERCWEEPPSPCTDASQAWTFQRVLQELSDIGQQSSSNLTLLGNQTDWDFFDF